LDIAELESIYDRSLAILEHHGQIAAMGVTCQFGQLIANLTGKAEDPTRLVGPKYDEGAQMAVFKAINYRGAAFVLTVVGTYVRYLFRDLAAARAYADLGAEYADGAVATYNVVWFHQYRALAILGAIETSSSDAVAEALKAIEPNVTQLRIWHRFSAVNHDHRMHLVDAEIARITGSDAAAGLYDRAVAAALANRFTHEAALANELAYRYHRGRGSEPLAQSYLAQAIAVYESWGASAKVAHLRTEAAAVIASTT
jgi:flavin-binding protein dodecin